MTFRYVKSVCQSWFGAVVGLAKRSAAFIRMKAAGLETGASARDARSARGSNDRCHHARDPLAAALGCATPSRARNGFAEPRDRQPKSTLSRPQPAAETVRPHLNLRKRPQIAGYSPETGIHRF